MATSRAHFTFFFCKAMRFPLSDTGSMRNSALIMRVFARFCKRLLSLKGSPGEGVKSAGSGYVRCLSACCCLFSRSHRSR